MNQKFEHNKQSWESWDDFDMESDSELDRDVKP